MTRPEDDVDAGGTRDAEIPGADAMAATDSAAPTGDGGSTTAGATDYAKAANWLCRPDKTTDACDVNLDTTIVKADGTLTVETFAAAANPPIDCFYVYPTVSVDATSNSDLVPGDEENNVVRAQFARYASHCRLFAPMYRQVTLTALRASIAGTAPADIDRAVGPRDVLDAWRWYMQNENKGRGVVLVGHSQGSGVLTTLVKEQIDPDPSKVPLLAAILLGTNITVPQGAVVGGSFQKVPLCTKPEELGCVVAYVSFRSNAPPPANTRFGKTMTAGQVVGCTNPAALGGGPAELHAYLSTAGAGASGLPMGPWVNNDPSKMVTTPFVSVPGLLTGECKSDASGQYLSIKVNGDPADPRVDEIVGDVNTGGTVMADWGLHLIDSHVTMGNQLKLVETKTRAFMMR